MMGEHRKAAGMVFGGRLLRSAVLGLALLAGGIVPALAAFDVKTATQGVVRIFAFDKNGKILGTGSGFIVSDDGHIVTNFHVIEGGASFAVALAGADVDKDKDAIQTVKKVVDASAEVDFALLKVDPIKGSRKVALSIAKPQSGDKVFALGFPGASDTLMNNLSLEPTYSDGSVSKVERGASEGAGTRMLVQHTAAISGGNSGGPLFNACNEVIGINTLGVGTKSGAMAAAIYAAVHTSEFAQRLVNAGVGMRPTERACVGGGGGWVSLPMMVAFAGLAIGGGLLLVGYGVIRRDSISALVKKGFGAAGRGSALPRPETARALSLKAADDQGATFSVDLTVKELTRSGGSVIGRGDEGVHIQIDDASVSRRHARLFIADRAVMIEDLGSTNGTFLDGARLAANEPKRLPDHGQIRLGQLKLAFKRGEI